MKWFRHIVKMDQTRLMKKVMEMGSSMKGGEGGQKEVAGPTRWFWERGKTIEDMKELARNTKEWKKWVTDKSESYLKAKRSWRRRSKIIRFRIVYTNCFLYLISKRQASLLCNWMFIYFPFLSCLVYILYHGVLNLI